MRTACASLLTCIVVVVSSGPVVALNESTHAIINDRAARVSELNETLMKRLGFSNGIEEPFNGKRVFQWLREGGEREDDGSLFLGTARYLRHFHDPLQPWDRAGLNSFFLGRYQSAVRWMQQPNQPGQDRCTSNWSWQAARWCYFVALTAARPAEREQAWADTFRALGQVAHLVADASVPEHARNDPHPLGPLFGSYEYWLSDQHRTRDGQTEFINQYLSSPMGPDSSILKEPTGDPNAPAPVAHLLDTNRYTGADPNVTLTGPIGIAEFSNANFFSEDTVHDDNGYPFPSVERLTDSKFPAPKTGRVRAYRAKGYGDGLAVDPVLAECVLEEAARDQGISGPTLRCVDERVWGQTAMIMLPRAVGYSATLLDYFFRGRLEARLEGGLRLANRTPGGTMTGAFELYYDASDGTRVFLTRWEALTLAWGEEHPPLTVPPHFPNKPPANPHSYLLVFRGQLGLEPDAVVPVRVTRNPVILVFFSHLGGWARHCGGGGGGQYAEGLEAYFGPTPASVPLIDPYGCPINVTESILYTLSSVSVPDDPAAPLTLRTVPWELVARVDVTPAPVYPDWANLRGFVNYLQLGLSMTGLSVVETDDSWRLTVVWADWVAGWSGAEVYLGHTPDGDIDVSPRVVKVCPGHEWASPYGGTVGPFGPKSLTHPKIYYCPDWWVFGD